MNFIFYTFRYWLIRDVFIVEILKCCQKYQKFGQTQRGNRFIAYFTILLVKSKLRLVTVNKKSVRWFYFPQFCVKFVSVVDRLITSETNSDALSLLINNIFNIHSLLFFPTVSNQNDSSGVVKELRDEIGRLRERLSEKSNNMIDMPDTDDVTRMEVQFSLRYSLKFLSFSLTRRNATYCYK